MANLMRFDPFSNLLSLQERMNQLFSQSLSPFSHIGREGEPSLTVSNFVPAVDVYEDGQNITIQAELPGIQEKDLDVRIDNNVLTISGERKLENEEKRENFHRIERSYGRFTRSFSLPTSVDAEHVNAEFENGVLKLTIPKKEEAKPKQIKIGIGKAQTLTGKTKAA